MPPISPHAAPAHAAGWIDATASPGGTFIDRARSMIAFLVEEEADMHAPLQRHERDLAEWIVRWRRMARRGPDTAEHFIADELGIIARALNGPAECTRLRPQRTDELCWLIARCISRRP